MRATVLLLIAGLLAIPTADATDIASQPLNYSLSTTVKPNIMFILDDSGSMERRFLPEEVGGRSGRQELQQFELLTHGRATKATRPRTPPRSTTSTTTRKRPTSPP